MVRVRKPQYARETQLASFCKLFYIHIYPAHNNQLRLGRWRLVGTSNQNISLHFHTVRIKVFH